MFGSAKDVMSDLSKRLANYYEKLVQTTAQFDELRVYTKETIDEFKRVIERQEDRVDRIEKDRIRAETELLTKINTLEGRLTALSEQALHAVAREAASTIMSNKLYHGELVDADNSSVGQKDGPERRLTNDSDSRSEGNV